MPTTQAVAQSEDVQKGQQDLAKKAAEEQQAKEQQAKTGQQEQAKTSQPGQQAQPTNQQAQSDGPINLQTGKPAENPEAGKEKSAEDQAKEAHAERQEMQIPERKDAVVEPVFQAGSSPEVSASTGGPGQPWADYASKQEELWKKNTGQPIERNADGVVKP